MFLLSNLNRLSDRIKLYIGSYFCCLTLYSHSIFASGNNNSDVISQYLYPYINLFVFIGLVIFFLKKPLKIFMKNRNKTIVSQLNNLESEHNKAKQEQIAIKNSFASLEEELKQIHYDLEKSNNAIIDKRKINLEVLCDKIRQEGDSTIKRDVDKAKQYLKKELLNEVFTDVKNKLLSSKEDQLKVANKAIHDVVKMM